MAFKSTFINVFQRGGRVQNNFPTAEPLSPYLQPLPLKELRGRARKHTHTHTIKQVSMKPFSEGARISIPEPELALPPRRTNFPNVTTSAQLIDLDWNTLSPVNGLYLSGSTKKSEIH